ncbi:MAG: hypothetical protein V4605_08865 [Pseudomonadota bacterium]
MNNQGRNKTAFLRNYTLKIEVGVKSEFGLRGSMLRVIAANVPIYFESRDGGSSFYLEAGEEIVFADNVFFELDVYHTSGVEQTIIIAVGENAKIGSVKLSGNVAITNLTLDNGRIQVAPIAYAASFASNTSLVAATAEVVVLPAANVNGLLIWNAQFVSHNVTNLSRTALIAKSSAPVSTVDGDSIISPQNVYLGGVFGVSGNLVTPVKIAAGKGLYFYTGAVNETFGSRSLLYTLL